MKVKAIDIARRLGISKATVSLALNGKPGVSDEKRALILKCKNEMEEQIKNAMEQLDQKHEEDFEPKEEKSEKNSPVYNGLMIKVIMYDRKLGIICDLALNIWTEILRIFDAEAKKAGYNIGITYVRNNEKEIKQVVEECNHSSVAGVILYGTEMKKGDFDFAFRTIKKPIVVFDYDAGCHYNSVVIDNADGAQKAVDYLISRGVKKINYLAQKIDIYNFECRRAGFVAAVYNAGLSMKECPIIPVGTTIDSVKSFMVNWLTTNELPEAFLMENYQVSLGVMSALKEVKIRVPEQISLIGMDALPLYMTGNKQLDCIKMEHRERGYATIALLLGEIKQAETRKKIKIESRCELLTGETVR